MVLQQKVALEGHPITTEDSGQGAAVGGKTGNPTTEPHRPQLSRIIRAKGVTAQHCGGSNTLRTRNQNHLLRHQKSTWCT